MVGRLWSEERIAVWLFALIDGVEDILVKMVHLGRREQFQTRDMISLASSLDSMDTHVAETWRTSLRAHRGW